ncbi:MAG TPA: STAS/SEC14 domain-containing protein [Anaerolineales bacterium]|nr:STAS/SEC14 domain-containing protein [Anaerolineales bacterium]
MDNHIGETRTRVAKIWLREDGIVQMVVDHQAKYTLADTKEGLACIVKVSKGKRRPLLADARNLKTMDFAGRQESAAFKDVMSVAILIDSAVSRMIGNVFLATQKTTFPVRLFTSETAAVEWLKEFLQ